MSKKKKKELRRYLSKEDIQMTNEHMKRYWTSLVMIETQIKTAMMYYCILTRMALINKRTTINFSDDVEKLKPSDLAVEM